MVLFAAERESHQRGEKKPDADVGKSNGEQPRARNPTHCRSRKNEIGQNDEKLWNHRNRGVIAVDATSPVPVAGNDAAVVHCNDIRGKSDQ